MAREPTPLNPRTPNGSRREQQTGHPPERNRSRANRPTDRPTRHPTPTPSRRQGQTTRRAPGEGSGRYKLSHPKSRPAYPLCLPLPGRGRPAVAPPSGVPPAAQPPGTPRGPFLAKNPVPPPPDPRHLTGAEGAGRGGPWRGGGRGFPKGGVGPPREAPTLSLYISKIELRLTCAF